MTALVAFTVVWAVLVVLALATALGATAWKLRQARLNLKGIADDLERIAEQTGGLEPKLAALGAEVEAIVGALSRVDKALGSVLDVVGELLAPKRG
jgi:septal ring factor EnvC (AmiA/AmiB activator)